MTQKQIMPWELFGPTKNLFVKLASVVVVLFVFVLGMIMGVPVMLYWLHGILGVFGYFT